MKAVYSQFDDLPLILTLNELALVYRLSVATIRQKLQDGTFAPRPWDKYPYRWRRDDVVADLKRGRPERPRGLHGFARPKAAKAELTPPPYSPPVRCSSARN